MYDTVEMFMLELIGCDPEDISMGPAADTAWSINILELMYAVGGRYREAALRISEERKAVGELLTALESRHNNKDICPECLSNVKEPTSCNHHWHCQAHGKQTSAKIANIDGACKDS